MKSNRLSAVLSNWTKNMLVANLGMSHKRGRETEKQCVLVAVERQGEVRAVLIDHVTTAEINLSIAGFVNKEAHLMTDKNPCYNKIRRDYAHHSSVDHSIKEYAKGNIHINTTESFGSMLEQTRKGVFYYMSDSHLARYLSEVRFRWYHLVPVHRINKNGIRKTRWKPMPIMETLCEMLKQAAGRQLCRSRNGGSVKPKNTAIFANITN